MPKRRSKVATSPALDVGNVVAAFSEEQVERMVGLSKGRLRYWARTGFFAPSYTEEDGRLPYSRFYSFKDIVALRTLEMLRVQNNVTLQHLRKVAEKLSHLRNDLWTKTTLYVVNRKVVLVNPETGNAQEVVSGQYVLGIPLAKIIGDTSADVNAFKKRRPGTLGIITKSRAVARNAPVVAGTRIPVGAIVRLTEDGYTAQQIIDEYPVLTNEDIAAALHYKNKDAA